MKMLSVLPFLAGIINTAIAIGINNRLTYWINGTMAVICYIAAIVYFIIGLQEEKKWKRQ